MSATVADLTGRRWVALDLDGVLYHGPAALPGAVEAVRALRASGLTICFVTNSSGSTRAQVADKLQRLGVPCDVDHLTTSSYVAARAAGRLVPDGQPVLLVGSAGLAQECSSVQLAVTDDPQEAGAVIVGLDVAFSYLRLAASLTALRRGVPLIGCNRDRNYPDVGGTLLPGCGPLLAAVEFAAGRTADVVVGKPAPQMLTNLWELTRTCRTDWFVVGDSVEADLGMAAAAGVPGVLVGPAGGYRDLADLTTALLDP